MRYKSPWKFADALKSPSASTGIPPSGTLLSGETWPYVRALSRNRDRKRK